MRRFNIPQQQQQQQQVQSSKFTSQQMNTRNAVYNNRQQQQQQQSPAHYNTNTISSFEGTYGRTSPLSKIQPPTDPKNEKLQAAREAREKLDLYRSFEEDEDEEFYPHRQQSQYGNYSFDNSTSSSSSYKMPIPSQQQQQQQQQQQIFRSPLSTPERTSFQSSLSTNKFYSTSVSNANDMYYSSPSPQRLNLNVVHNQSSTPFSNRSVSILGRPTSGQLYYTPQNSGRSRY